MVYAVIGVAAFLFGRLLRSWGRRILVVDVDWVRAVGFRSHSAT
ncbi:MAG: hypothetical protein ACRDRO_24870 [Pseudonocardiaceae bacterium]